MGPLSLTKTSLCGAWLYFWNLFNVIMEFYVFVRKLFCCTYINYFSVLVCSELYKMNGFLMWCSLTPVTTYIPLSKFW